MSSVEWPRNFGAPAPAPVDVLDPVVMRTPTDIGTGIATVQSQDIVAPADLVVGDLIVIFGSYDNDSAGVADPVITGGSNAIWAMVGDASTGGSGVGGFIAFRKATTADIGATFTVDLGKAETWVMQCLGVTEATGAVEMAPAVQTYASGISRDVEGISPSWGVNRTTTFLMFAFGDGGGGWQYSSAPPEAIDAHYAHTGTGNGSSTASAWAQSKVATFDPGAFGRNTAANQTSAILAIELRL